MLVCDTQLAMSLFFGINQHGRTKIGRISQSFMLIFEMPEK